FHPALWTNALGSKMPAPEGDVTLGIAQALMPLRPDAKIWVQLEKEDVAHAARLGAQATLTVVFDEGEDKEKIVKVPVRFARDGSNEQEFTLDQLRSSEGKP
ncbi:MAG TPA: hypothetical protein PK156_25995, partial [Polyangium sp.]|nr:hypothetical protein [Polyangium sp.]